MKVLIRFIRTTLVGGILFLVPVVIVIVVLGKALEIAAKIVDPLAKELPVHSPIGLPMPIFLAILLIILFCVLTGMYARTRAAGRIVFWLEEGVLTNVPGYAFFKDVGQSMLGVKPQHTQQTVLVRVEESWQMAFVMERLAGGRAVVFVPEAPSPWTGSVHIVEEDRIETVALSTVAALKCLRRLGGGSGALFKEWAEATKGNKPA